MSKSDKFIEWHENGIKKIDKNYKTLEYKVWHDNGQILFDEFLDHNDCLKTTIWFKNGLKMMERNFANGFKHGKSVEWLSNGQKLSEETYVNGVLIDSWSLTESMSEEEKLRHEFIRIREKIDLFNGIYLYFNFHHPIRDFPNKDLYPIDFQIYMEEIGEITIGDGGMLIIEIHRPMSSFVEKAVDVEDYIFSSYFLAQTPEEEEVMEMMDGSPGIKIKALDYKIVAADCHMGTYGYYTGNKPYQFVSSQNFQGGKNFLDWLKFVLNNDLEHALFDIRLKLGFLQKFGGGNFF